MRARASERLIECTFWNSPSLRSDVASSSPPTCSRALEVGAVAFVCAIVRMSVNGGPKGGWLDCGERSLMNLLSAGLWNFTRTSTAPKGRGGVAKTRPFELLIRHHYFYSVTARRDHPQPDKYLKRTPSALCDIKSLSLHGIYFLLYILSNPSNRPSTVSMSHKSSSDVESIDELPQTERMVLAIKAYREDPKSMRRIAKQYGVPKSSLFDRINGAASKKEESQRRQRLSPQEEQAIVNWLLRLQGWGWPARTGQIRDLTTELLRKKGDTKALGVNWVQKLLRRHHDLKSADKEHAMVRDRQIFDNWFTLYSKAKAEYSIYESDIWNMDEKGFMQEVIEKNRVFASKHEKKTYIMQPDNRELVSLIESVSMDDKVLTP